MNQNQERVLLVCYTSCALGAHGNHTSLIKGVVALLGISVHIKNASVAAGTFTASQCKSAVARGDWLFLVFKRKTKICPTKLMDPVHRADKGALSTLP